MLSEQPEVSDKISFRTRIVEAMNRFQNRFKRTPRSNGSGNKVIPVFWGPAYDVQTRYTSAWMEELLQNLVGIHSLSAIGSIVSKEDIARTLEETSGSARVKIFYGHGTDHALLGPSFGDEADIWIDGTRHSVVFDSDMILPLRAGPSSLFAFCCRAGRELGVAFAAYEHRNFLGYTVDLPFEIGNAECETTWKEIVHGITLDIIRDGGLNRSHKDRLTDLYHHAFLDYWEGGKKENELRPLMMLYLLEHKDGVCWHEG